MKQLNSKTRSKVTARLILCLALGLWSAAPAQCIAQAPAASESAVKAAFVYNFVKFVEWPPESLVGVQSDVIICIAGTSPDLAAAFAGLKGKPAKNRAVEIRNDVRASELDICNVLFAGGDASDLMNSARARPGLLTVSDMPGFCASGGVIELFKDDGRVRFEINPHAAGAAGLKVSSQLMKLARVTPGK